LAVPTPPAQAAAEQPEARRLVAALRPLAVQHSQLGRLATAVVLSVVPLAASEESRLQPAVVALQLKRELQDVAQAAPLRAWAASVSAAPVARAPELPPSLRSMALQLEALARAV
jgi:hypothetical protein